MSGLASQSWVKSLLKKTIAKQKTDKSISYSNLSDVPVTTRVVAEISDQGMATVTFKVTTSDQYYRSGVLVMVGSQDPGHQGLFLARLSQNGCGVDRIAAGTTTLPNLTVSYSSGYTYTFTVTNGTAQWGVISLIALRGYGSLTVSDITRS